MAVGKRGDGGPPALMGWDAPLSPELDQEASDDSLFPAPAERAAPLQASEVALTAAMVLASIVFTTLLLLAAGAFGPGASTEPAASSQRR